MKCADCLLGALERSFDAFYKTYTFLDRTIDHFHSSTHNIQLMPMIHQMQTLEQFMSDKSFQ